MKYSTTTRPSLALALATLPLMVLWSSPLLAQPHPWPFDFDAELAADPAGIEAGLDDLGSGLPGLRPEELVEVPLGPVTLYMFPSLAEALDRAVTSGPGVMPEVVRTPVICATHESFVYSSQLVPSPSSECVAAEQVVAAAFVGNSAVCTEVEFPETYVFDHPPGHVDRGVVRSLEGLIAVAGEALSHIDYPMGLLQEGFFRALRPVIAKIRYHLLMERLDGREAAYTNAVEELARSTTCFLPEPRVVLETALDELLAELEEARTQLVGIYEEGLAQAAADQAAARADCRARQDLPHPALTDAERLLLAHYVGGIFWRARGAGLLAYPPDPEMGLLRRGLYVGEAFQVLASMSGGEGAAGVGRNILIDENWGWDEWWDMGTTPGSADKYSDLVGMTKRGKRGVSLARPQIGGRGYDIRSLVGGAMMMGPCYYYAWELLADFRLGDDLDDPYMWFIEWPTSIGEFCAGAALAEGLTRTMLWGTPIPPEECVEPECPGGGCADAGVDGGADAGVDGGADAGDDGGLLPDGGNPSCGECPLGQECNSFGVCAPSGEGGDDPYTADSGCGCSTGTQGGGGGLWLAIAITLGVLRRRTEKIEGQRRSES